eukprot:SAG22_NODE_2893_length_2120_cov_98.588817_2_plen_303_part_00
MKIVDKRMVFINSNERDGGTISDFTIGLPPNLLTRNNNQSMRMVLNDLVLPYTWYNVQSSNQTFNVRENSESDLFECILTPGSYHVLQLRDHLKNRLDYYSSVYGFDYTYTVTYDEVAATFTFQANKSGFTPIVSFEFDSTSSYRLLGFQPNSVNHFATVDNQQVLVSTKSVNMMFTDALYLHCDLPTSNVNKGAGDKSTYSVSHAFAKIPVNTTPFSNIIYNNVNDDFVNNIPERFLNTIRFKFHTLEHNDIELNDDFSFTLKIEIIEDDERLIVNQNTAIGELLRTLLLQQHVKKSDENK